MKDIYQHFKGKLYTVIGEVTHSETLETMILYYPNDNPSEIWVRPKQMWDEVVELNGQWIKRFRKVPAA